MCGTIIFINVSNYIMLCFEEFWMPDDLCEVLYGQRCLLTFIGHFCTYNDWAIIIIITIPRIPCAHKMLAIM